MQNMIADILPSNNNINPQLSSFFGISYTISLFVPRTNKLNKKKRRSISLFATHGTAKPPTHKQVTPPRYERSV